MSSDAKGEAISPCRVTIRTEPELIASSSQRSARAGRAPDRGIRETSRRRSGNRETCPRPGAGPWREPLEPERRPLAGIRPGHEQRPRRVLAEAQAVERGFGKLKADQSLGLVGGQSRRADRAVDHPFRAAGTRARRLHAGTRPGCRNARECGPGARASVPGAACRQTGKEQPGQARQPDRERSRPGSSGRRAQRPRPAAWRAT